MAVKLGSSGELILFASGGLVQAWPISRMPSQNAESIGLSPMVCFNDKKSGMKGVKLIGI